MRQSDEGNSFFGGHFEITEPRVPERVLVAAPKISVKNERIVILLLRIPVILSVFSLLLRKKKKLPIRHRYKPPYHNEPPECGFGRTHP